MRAWADEPRRKKDWLREQLARCCAKAPIDPSLYCVFRTEGGPGPGPGGLEEIGARMAGMDPADRAELEEQSSPAKYPYCWQVRFLGVLDGQVARLYQTGGFRTKHPFMIAAEFGSPEQLAAVAEWCLGESPSDYLLVDAAQTLDLSAPEAAKAKLAFLLARLSRVTVWSLRCLGRFREELGLAAVLGAAIARRVDAAAAGELLLKGRADPLVPNAEWAFSFLEAIIRRAGGRA